MRKRWIGFGVALALGACAPTYTLAPPATTGVANGKMRITPGMAWNRAPHTGPVIAEEEVWTENGPLLDSIGFIAALPEGHAITRQKAKADQKAPAFQANMSPQDLTSMIETLHRVRGDTVFDSIAVAPRQFLGQPGLQYDYRFVGADDVKRRGRVVIAVIDRRLYLIALEAAASHYYEAALPDFERMADSAALR